jgi:hypothetical protein
LDEKDVSIEKYSVQAGPDFRGQMNSKPTTQKIFKKNFIQFNQDLKNDSI